ncbi:MAG: LysR substrate-binding domain-containing protein [Hyphomonadaceae bacterium]
MSLPSLQTLRAFEAAARLKSYSKAAEELGLTHGAVSHRIRELEQRLGVTLFKRAGNTMQLTNDALQLEAQVRQGLSILEQAFPSKRPSAKPARQIVVASVPSIASTWLFSRMAQFRAENPGLDIDLRVSEALSDYRKDGIDIGVRLGRGGWPGLHAQKLFDEALTPVCTPDYRDRIGLHAPADLQRATLMRNPWTPWARWFSAAGLAWPEPNTGPKFDDALLLLRAALDSQGVALGRHWLAIDELRAGRLIAPFDISVRDDLAYWLVWPTGKSLKPDAARFRDWIDAKAAAEEPICPMAIAEAVE